MRRRYVLALVLATALIFALGGVSFGRYAIPRSDSETGNCTLANVLEDFGSLVGSGTDDDNCPR